MILTKHTAQITPGEENRPTTMESLDTRFLAPMRRNDIDLCRLGTDHAHPRCFKPIYAAFARTQIAVR